MRLLIDQKLARRVAALLGDAGHDAVHVGDRGLSAAEDEEILAARELEAGAVVVLARGRAGFGVYPSCQPTELPTG